MPSKVNKLCKRLAVGFRIYIHGSPRSTPVIFHHASWRSVYELHWSMFKSSKRFSRRTPLAMLTLNGRVQSRACCSLNGNQANSFSQITNSSIQLHVALCPFSSNIWQIQVSLWYEIAYSSSSFELYLNTYNFWLVSIAVISRYVFCHLLYNLCPGLQFHKSLLGLQPVESLSKIQAFGNFRSSHRQGEEIIRENQLTTPIK